jgi:endonuclease/exonuclease/phosphatase family metal-dependent hydrolase
MVSSLLTVMTWNMWFDKTNRAQRTETLLNEVRSYDPDIVALQEVVQESLNIIIAKMHPTYYIIGMISSEIGYDTIILSKFPPIEWDRYYLPKTKMGRNLLLATLQTPTRQITVGTFHLESVFFPRVKEAEDLKESQLKYIYAISPLNSILMGDTNLTQLPLSQRGIPLPLSQRGIPPNTEPISSPYIIDVYEEYTVSQQPLSERGLPLPLSERGLPLPLSERGLPPNIDPISSPYIIVASEGNTAFNQQDVSASQTDAHSLGVCPFSKGAGVSPFSKGAGVSPFSKGAGATYCGHTNKHVKNKSIQSRLDRIYVKIKRNSLKVHFYGLTGTVTQPSDHFGVFAQIEF